MVQAHLSSVEQSMSGGQGVDYIRREPPALQRHHIDAARSRGWAFHEHERWHVLQHAAESGDKGVAADGREKMHRRGPRERGIILDVHVST